MKWCPKCKSNSHVVDSRSLTNEVIRRRVCANDACGHHWMTIESDCARKGRISRGDTQRIVGALNNLSNRMKKLETEIFEQLIGLSDDQAQTPTEKAHGMDASDEELSSSQLREARQPQVRRAS